jgi:DNA-binding PadR family transcriptional regulator
MSLLDVLARLINGDPGVTQERLEKRAMRETRLPKSSIIKGIGRLEKQGKIRRERDQGGRKVYPN